MKYVFIICWPVLLILKGCTGVAVISNEEPYRSMIGDCYVIQKNMNIHDNGCWDIGGFILSPDKHSCFKTSVGSLSQGSKITIAEIRQRQFGTVGPCPQIIVDIEGFETVDREIYIPLCFSAQTISWLEDPLWYRGDDIKLKEKYVKRCENARTSKMGESTCCD